MKTRHQFFLRSISTNYFLGWLSKTALAISIGIAMNACTTDQPSEKSVSVASSRINLTPLLTLAIAEMEHDVDTARECSIDRKVVAACIFV